MFTNNGKIIKYNKTNGSLKIVEIEKLKNKAIYDACILNENQFVIYGGNTKVSKGIIAVSKGFVAVIDTSLNNFNFIWKNPFYFVWHVETYNNNIYLSAFNGFYSHLVSIHSKNYKITDKIKISGLVYRFIHLQGDTVIFWGSKTASIKKNGMIGILSSDGKISKFSIPNTGCIWDLKVLENNYICSTQKGTVLFFPKPDFKSKKIKHLTTYKLYDNIPIYEMFLTNKKIYCAGSKNLLFVLEKNDTDYSKDDIECINKYFKK